MTKKIDDEQEVIAELEANGLSKKRRRALLVKLRKVGTERSIDILQANLRSVDVKGQVRAVFALAHIGTDEAADALIDCLSLETGPRFAFALKALVDAHPARAMPAFLRTLEERYDELDQGSKQLLVYALYQIPHRNQVPVLTLLLRERNRQTRRVAAVALAQIRTPESREALEEAVASLSWLRGLQARRALRSLRYVSWE